MAGKPDLVGKVFALREDKTDPEQPWLVQCVVHNQGTGPAGTFKVRLTTKIAAMQPGEERSVTVVGFVTSSCPSAASSRPIPS